MAGRYLTDMADVLRSAGLTVVECSGWKTNARSSGGYADGRPTCVMWHHTASKSTPLNDVTYMIRNSGDRPIANLYLARDGDVWVMAAGATNTNGRGGPLSFSKATVSQDTMNLHAIGIEAANDGRGESWSQVQIDAYFKTHIALCKAYNMQVTDLATHNLWAPTRKVDPATAQAVQGPWKPAATGTIGTWTTASIQAEAVRRATPTPPPKPPTFPPTPPAQPGYSVPAPTKEDISMVVALDKNGTAWVGDGISRLPLQDEAVFNEYIKLGKGNAYRFVNTSGQGVSGWSNVSTVGDTTIAALGKPV